MSKKATHYRADARKQINGKYTASIYLGGKYIEYVGLYKSKEEALEAGKHYLATGEKIPPESFRYPRVVVWQMGERFYVYELLGPGNRKLIRSRATREQAQELADHYADTGEVLPKGKGGRKPKRTTDDSQELNES